MTTQPVPLAPPPMDEEDLIRRAYAAWFRSGGTAEPHRRLCGTEAIDGKWYAVLRNANGVLAVYRILNSGALKRLRRPPSELLKATP